MKHPTNNESADRKICPVTGKRFKLCWTNNLAKPWIEYGECDQCRETPAESLKKLNDKARDE